MKKLIIFILTLSISALYGQEKEVKPPKLDFDEYEPKSTLVVPEHIIKRAKFPFIDVHNHQNNIPEQDLKKLTLEMDSLNMAVMVNLSGKGFRRLVNKNGKTYFVVNGDDFLVKSFAAINAKAQNRLVIFTNLDFSDIDSANWTKKAVLQLEKDVKIGANGLKLFKNFGMDLKDEFGNRVKTNDARLDPIWAKCGELGIPVLIHTGEPIAFFDPQDKNNERLLELSQFPGRARPADKYPSWHEIMGEQHQMFKKHPKTKFINAHMGWMANDLEGFGKLMDEIPNMYTEIGAIIHELGRQPRAARAFFIKYQDRILFGKDIYNPAEYHTYFRLLETADEYFPYYRKRHAFWRIYGLDLPDEVLKKVYYKNALKIVPGINKSYFPK
jgi:uncharacterized protein